MITNTLIFFYHHVTPIILKINICMIIIINIYYYELIINVYSYELAVDVVPLF